MLLTFFVSNASKFYEKRSSNVGCSTGVDAQMSGRVSEEEKEELATRLAGKIED